MDKEVKQLKKSLVTAIAGFLFLIIVATGTTYAWFTLSGRASTNVTPTGGTISQGDAVLLISNSASGPFDKTCNLVLAGNPETLKPLSTANLENFYKSTAQNEDGISILYTSVDNVDQNTLHGTVYLQCQNAPCSVYFNPSELNLGSDVQALAAMRLGLKITSHAGTETLIFRLDDLGATQNAQSNRTVPTASTVVSSISASGQAAYVNDPAQNLSGYMAQPGADGITFRAGTTPLILLNKDEVATVEYWLYLEGCDDECYNVVHNRTSEIALAFAGVAADEE